MVERKWARVTIMTVLDSILQVETHIDQVSVAAHFVAISVSRSLATGIATFLNCVFRRRVALRHNRRNPAHLRFALPALVLDAGPALADFVAAAFFAPGPV